MQVRFFPSTARCRKRYLQNNPYRLAAEVDGIGFRTADQMAQAMGRPRNSDERLEAGIEYALSLVGKPDTAAFQKKCCAVSAANFWAWIRWRWESVCGVL